MRELRDFYLTEYQRISEENHELRQLIQALQEGVGQCMCQPVIAADKRLEMVVDAGTLNPVKNGVGVGLPLVGGLEIPQRLGGSVGHRRLV